MGRQDEQKRVTGAPTCATPAEIRWEAHRAANALGHVPLKCGTSYECPRCGASGAADDQGRRGTIFAAPCAGEIPAPTTLYAQRIAEATGESDPATLGAIEALMRAESDLRRLSPQAFRDEAITARRVLRSLSDSARAYYLAAVTHG